MKQKTKASSTFEEKTGMPKPDLSAVPGFYHNYIKLIDGDDLKNELKNNTLESISLLE